MRPYSEVRDMVKLGNPAISQPVRVTFNWVEKFLCACIRDQHVVGNRKDLAGKPVTQQMFDAHERPAHGCPFVRDSLDQDLLWFDECTLDDQRPNQIEGFLRQQLADFLANQPTYYPIQAGSGPAPGLAKNLCDGVSERNVR